MNFSIIFRPLFLLILVLIFQLPSSKCRAEKLPVAASIYPVADMIRAVGGERVAITHILPAGASPHTFEPKPSLVKKITAARVFFMIGAGLELWVEKFVRLADSGLKTVVLSAGMPLIHSAGHSHNDNHHQNGSNTSDNQPEVANPHIWLDPQIAKSMTNKIIAALGDVDPRNYEFYQQRGKKYIAELDELDKQIQASVRTFKIKKFVAFHASWDYFARRYGLEPVAAIESAAGRNPTPTHIKRIVTTIREHRIRAVFSEPQLNPRAARVIANETGAVVFLLDPMGAPDLKGRDTYIDLMKYNLNVLKEAMQ